MNNHLNDLFSLLAEEKRKKKEFEDRIKTAARKDFNEVFKQLSPHSKPKEIVEEVLVETKPISTPIGEIPVSQQNPAIANLPDIDKYLRTPQVSEPNTSEYDINLINKKIKFLEQWIGKINNAGPGGGEVWLKRLDDVTISNPTYGDGLVWSGTKWTNSSSINYNSYTLPIASSTVLGGFKVGGNLTIDSSTGIMNANNQLGNLYVTDQTVHGTNVNGDITLTPNGTGLVAVPGLKIPTGTVITGSAPIVANIANLILASVIDHSSTTALTTGQYGISNGIPTPWTVYSFTTTPSPVLQVGDIIAGPGIPANSTVVYIGTNSYSTYVIVNTDFGTATPPASGITITTARQITNAGVAITTGSNTDITLNAGSGGHVVTHSDILPYTTNQWSLGSPGARFKEIWLGAGTIYVLDETLGVDQSIGARNGNLYISGGAGLEVGNFLLNSNKIGLIDTTQDLLLGTVGATGKFYINRSTIVDSGNFTVLSTSFGANDSPMTIRGQGGLTDGVALGNAGTLAHLINQYGQAARFVMDSYGIGGGTTYNVLAGRSARGTITSPTATQSGDILLRLAGNGYDSTNGFNQFGTGRIDIVAAENYTATAKGTKFTFNPTALGTNSIVNAATVDSTGLTFVGAASTTAGITFRDSTRLTSFPAQTSNSGKYLTTDGTSLSWSTIPTITGAVVYKGGWDASANTPTLSTSLPSGVQSGWEYSITATGSQNINGTGSVTYQAGGFVIFNGSTWVYVPPATGVSSFNTRTGAVTLTSSDVTGALSNGSITNSLLANNSITITGGTGIGITGTNPVALGGTIAINNTGVTSTTGTNHISVNQTSGAVTVTSDAVATNTAGTLVSRDGSGNFSANVITANLTGNVTGNVSGNAGTVTNGLYSTGTYADPSWITSLAYSKLTGTPTIPAAQIQSDWNQSNNASLDYIKNKPTIPAAQVNSDWNATSGLAQILNKPTIPTVGADDFSSTVTTQASTLTVDFTGSSVIFWQPSANGNRTITLSNFTAGRRVKIFITPHRAQDTFTFTGVTASQCSNGSITYVLGGGGVAQSSMMIEVFSTTTAIGGVWIFGFGSQ